MKYLLVSFISLLTFAGDVELKVSTVSTKGFMFHNLYEWKLVGSEARFCTHGRGDFVVTIPCSFYDKAKELSEK